MRDEKPTDAVERSRAVRRKVAETIARFRRLADEAGAGEQPAPPAERTVERSGRALMPDVSAVVERARQVIENTRRVLEQGAERAKGSVEKRGARRGEPRDGS